MGSPAFARGPPFRLTLLHRSFRRGCRRQWKRRAASVIAAAPGSVHVSIMRRSGGRAARGCAASAVDLDDHGFLVVVLLSGLAVVGVARGQHLDVAFWQFPFSRSVPTKRNLGENARNRTLGKRSRDRGRLKRNRKCIRSGRKRIRLRRTGSGRKRIRLKRTGSGRKRIKLRRTGSWASSCGPLLGRLRRRARPLTLALRVGMFVLARRTLRQHRSCDNFNQICS